MSGEYNKFENDMLSITEPIANKFNAIENIGIRPTIDTIGTASMVSITESIANKFSAIENIGIKSTIDTIGIASMTSITKFLNRGIITELESCLQQEDIEIIDINNGLKKSIFTKNKLLLEDVYFKIVNKAKSVFALSKIKDDLESDFRKYVIGFIIHILISPTIPPIQSNITDIEVNDKYMYIQNEGQTIMVLKSKNLIKKIEEFKEEIEKNKLQNF